MPNEDVEKSAKDAVTTTSKSKTKTKAKAKTKTKTKAKAKTKTKTKTKTKAKAKAKAKTKAKAKGKANPGAATSSVPPVGWSSASQKAPPTKSTSSTNRKRSIKEGASETVPGIELGSDSTIQNMIGWLRKLKGSSAQRIDVVFDQAVKATGAVVDSKAAKKLKEKALSAYDLAFSIGKNLVDVNGDGKVNADDLKALVEKTIEALEKANKKLDPDLKTALLAGVVACGAMFLIPLVGQSLAIPVFAAATAFFYLKAKLAKIGKE